AIRHAVPTIFGFREFVAAGGLMSYGGSLTESFRWVGVYTGRVLKGEKLNADRDQSAFAVASHNKTAHPLVERRAPPQKEQSIRSAGWAQASMHQVGKLTAAPGLQPNAAVAMFGSSPSSPPTRR